MHFVVRARYAAVLAVVAFMLLGQVDRAHGQEQTPTPSASELWETYPLHSRPRSRVTPTPTADSTPAGRVSDPATVPAAGIDAVLPALLIGLAVAAGLLLGFLTLRSRRAERRGASEPVPPDPGTARPSGSAPAARTQPAEKPAEPQPGARKWLAAVGESRRPRPAATRLRGRSNSHAARSAGGSRRAVPPDPRSGWTADVDWVRTGGGARFRVLARSEEHDDATVIVESSPLEWPPTSSDAVEKLTRAVDQLEFMLLSAGWTRLEAGKEWYAKRFAWEPAAAAAGSTPGEARRPLLPPVPAIEQDRQRAGRFVPRSAWPDGSEALWRCQICWHVASDGSRFAAVAYAPGERRGRTVRDAAAVSWPVSDEPDPELEDCKRELRRLAAALHDAGWDRLGRGPNWYAARFVWRRTGTPPDRLEARVREA